MRENRPATLDEATAMRMSEFADLAESGATEMTGKLKYSHVSDFDRGEVVGRYGGLKPQYPELARFSAGPKVIAKTIRRGSGKAYDRLYAAMRGQMEKEGFKPARARSVGRPTVPGHSPMRGSCTHCKAPHTTGQHRFHGGGSFHKTHMWGFNPMTVSEAARILEKLSTSAKPLMPSDRALMRKCAQALRANRRTTAKHNPGGQAECIGTLEELRYHRTIGRNPGYYKHVYKSAPRVWCLPNGDVLIKAGASR